MRTKTDGKGTEKKLYMQVIRWKKCNFSSNYIKLLRADLYLTTTSTRFRDQSTSCRAQRDSSYQKYPVQFNGKMRFTIEVAKDTPREEVEKVVMAHELTAKQLNGAAPKKVIVVPGKIVNMVM